ncbi:MAG: inositol monophosphatase family protein, partial [Planctomycetia bacterium]
MSTPTLPPDPGPELATAVEAARAAGDVIRRYWRDGVVMRSKAAFDLVSDADVDAEKAVVACIRKAHPTHEIIGEEGQTGDSAAEHVWVVDPLDGTNNFAHKVPHFAVSIGYYRAGVGHVGVVYNPIRDDWYVAEAGKGAWSDGARLHVSPAAALDEVLVGVGFYYDRGAMMTSTLSAISELFGRHIHGIRRFG